MKKHIIWSGDINLDDWRDDLREEYPDASDDELYQIAWEINNDYLEDDLGEALTECKLTEPVIVIADLGLWYGRRSGYKCLYCKDAGEALKRAFGGSGDEPSEIYVDERGDLGYTRHHHDGTNYAIIREWKPEASERQRDNLCSKIYNGTATREDITRVTRSLGKQIANVYMWND